MARRQTLTSLKRTVNKWLSVAIRYERADKKTGLCTCITCGVKRPPNKMQAGHFLDGSTNASRFSEIQIHPQCYACNVLMNGNKVLYFLQMERKYGREVVDQIISHDKRTVRFCEDRLRASVVVTKRRAQEAVAKYRAGLESRNAEP